MALNDTQAAILAYVCEHPGGTSKEVAQGVGLAKEITRRQLENLCTKRLVGRQSSLRSQILARWFPEQVALYAHQRAKETLA